MRIIERTKRWLLFRRLRKEIKARQGQRALAKSILAFIKKQEGKKR